MIAFENFENVATTVVGSSSKDLSAQHNPILGNQFALITEFSLQYEGVQMNNPGDGLPLNEHVVEEELVDNQDTETIAEYKPPHSQTSQKIDSMQGIKPNMNRPASEVFTSSSSKAEDQEKTGNGFGKRKSSSSQSALIQSSSKINNRYSTQVPLM